MTRLQRILHIAARITTLAPPSRDIKEILKNLHWLLVEQRIKYKILLLTFRAVNGIAPLYIELSLLTVSPTTLKTFGDRAFSAIAPKLWNELPLDIREIVTLGSFKTAIKTVLFKQCYGNH